MRCVIHGSLSLVFKIVLALVDQSVLGRDHLMKAEQHQPGVQSYLFPCSCSGYNSYRSGRMFFYDNVLYKMITMKTLTPSEYWKPIWLVCGQVSLTLCMETVSLHLTIRRAIGSGGRVLVQAAGHWIRQQAIGSGSRPLVQAAGHWFRQQAIWQINAPPPK